MSSQQPRLQASEPSAAAAHRESPPRADQVPRPYGPRLGRYLRREIAFPTAYTLLGLGALMLARQMLGFSDWVVNRGLSGTTVGEIALLQLVPLLSEMLPLSVLVGSLVALGRLAADREILALEACGLAAQRLTYPVATFGVGATLVGLLLAAVLAPASLRRLDARLAEVARERPGVTLRAGEAERFGDWRLEAREVSSTGNQLRGVALEVPELGETIFAESGGLEAMPDGGTRIVLRNGVFVSMARRDPWKVQFDEVSTQLPGSGSSTGRPKPRDQDSRPLGELVAQAWSGGADAASQAARRELNRRLARPFAAFVFGLLAAPLFLARGGRSRAGGGLLGIVSVLVYYALLQLGTWLDAVALLPEGAGQWLPNLCLLGLALVLHRGVADRSPLAGREKRTARDGLARALRRWQHRAERRATRAGPTRPLEPPRRIAAHRWALPRYVAKSFLALLGLSFGVLLTAYLVVDVLERLAWFARFDATASEAVRYYGLRVPLLISRIVPMSLLVATALSVSLTGARGELTAMRVSGIPAARGMLPALLLCALIAPLSFLLNDRIVPRTNFLNEVLKETEIKLEEHWSAPTGDDAGQKAVWLLEGPRLVEADRLDPQLGIVQGLTIYDLDERGLPLMRLDARAARHLGGGTWHLVDPVHVDLSTDTISAQPGPAFAALWEEVPVETDTRNLSVAALRREIAWADENGYDSTALRVDRASRVAAPFACLLLPAVIFLYALSGPPYPKTASALVASVALGVGSVLLGDFATSLGYGGVLSPQLAGWAPNATYGILSLYLFVRLLRRA
jgi:LPS export ABC transporter permease LptF/LPS export ABC transporter permease LptG